LTETENSTVTLLFRSHGRKIAQGQLVGFQGGKAYAL